MRLVVEIESGKLAQRKVVLVAGQSFSFGRSDLADQTILHDGKLDAQHFRIHWNGQRARVEDLASRGGTWIDGERKHDADLEHGSWVRAGDTDFGIRHELCTPPWEPTVIDTAQAHAALVQLRALIGTLYAVLDGARSDRIPVLLHEATDAYRSLYDGIDGQCLAEAAPYVVKLHDDSALLERLLLEGFGQRWGIFVVSRLSLAKVRQHLRRFLMVKDDATEEQLYFRYYDPGVFDAFADVISARQQGELLADLDAVLWEGPAGELRRMEAR